MERAVENAEWFLILASAHSRAGAWQDFEWRAALIRAWADDRAKLIPIIVEGTEPPPFLRNWSPVTVDPSAEPATWTRHVLRELLSVRIRPPQGLTPEDKLKRDQRFDEMSKALEELKKRETSEPPAASKF